VSMVLVMFCVNKLYEFYDLNYELLCILKNRSLNAVNKDRTTSNR